MKVKPSYITMSPKAIFVLLSSLYLIFLVSGSIATAQDSNSKGSFETPEETITRYLEALIEGDALEIMRTSAIDEMSENFRFDLFVNRVQVLFPDAPAPSDYPFYMEMNKAQFSWQVLFQTKNLAYGLLATEKGIVEGRTVLLDPEGTTAFMNEVDPARLDQLKIVTIALPQPDLAQDERTLENWNQLAEIYGADELTERVALLLFEENYYYVGFTLLRYGEDWKINRVNSTLANTNAMGGPTQTTEEEFQELIGGN